FLRFGLGRQPYGPKFPDIAVGDAAKQPLAEMVFPSFYIGLGRHDAPDAGHLTSIDILGGFEILLLVVRREIEKRHVLFRERASAGLIDFSDQILDQVLRMTLTLGSPLSIVSFAGDWIG